MLFRRRSTRSTLRPAALLARAEDARASRSRRASVIILALAVLAVIAVAGVAYVTVVRLDRSSASSYAETVNYQQQINAVIEEIRALLTADLYGNKLVNTTTPRRQIVSDPTSAEVWPRAFEDGEHFDYPQVALYREGAGGPTADDITFDTRRPNQLAADLQGDEAFVLDPSALTARGSTTDRYAIGLQDDAWLASFEPIHIPRGAARDWNVWPQITNLRSAYRYQQPRDSTRPGYWVRDDGLYVDLAQWFLQQTNDMRGNPSARLSRDDSSANAAPWGDPIIQRRYVSDAVEASRNANGPVAGMFQQAFERSMSEMDKASPNYINETFDLADERMWVDTDGDGFPDARWQQLDSLGELFGLRWVVAARIIDNSALANVNAHLSLSSPSNPGDDNLVGDGTTPADVDLFRLLTGASDSAGNAPYPDRTHPDVRAGDWNRARILRAFSRGALVNGLGVDELMSQLETDRRPGVRFKSGLSRLYSNPAGDYTTGATETALGNTGSLNRAQKEAFWRFFGTSPVDPIATRGSGFPVADEIDLRTYNGNNYESLLSKLEQSFDYSDDGSFLPPATGSRAVGVLRSSIRGAIDRYRNPSDPQREPLEDRIERVRTDVRRLLTSVSGAGNASPIPASSPVPKVPLTPEAFLSGTSGAPSVNGRTVKDAFQAFVWALAPFATDRPMIRGQTREQLADLQNNDTTLRDLCYGGGGADRPAEVGQYPGASYSVITAASLATNLAASIVDIDQPVVTRVFPSVAQSDNPLTQEIELGVGFQHGAIGVPAGASDLDGVRFTTDLLNSDFFGAETTGVTLLGLGAQPFLTEATAVAAYRNFDPDDPATGENPVRLQNTAIPNYQLGSIVAFELANPWPRTISLVGYSVRIMAPGVGGPMLELTLGSATIPAGQRAVFYMAVGNTADYIDEWEDFKQGWLDQIRAQGVVNDYEIDVSAATPPQTDWASPYMSFQHFASQSAASSVLLIRNGKLLVDRLSPDITDTDLFPYLAPADVDFPGDLLPGPTPPRETGSGRRAYVSNIRRPKNPAAPGFPWYVIERRAFNEVENLTIDQTWRLFPLPQEDGLTGEDPVVMGQNCVIGNGADDANNLGEDDAITLTGLPKFELFITPPAPTATGAPKGSPLAATSEVALISTVCGMYKNPDAQSVFGPTDTLANATAPQVATPGRLNDGQWITFSERLGFAENMGERTAGVANPWFAILDPSRYILRADAGTVADLGVVENLPDTMAIPLATRVFDCFDALADSSRLVNGRINVNTAPREVLEILPFLDPLSQFMGPNTYNAVSSAGAVPVGARVQALLQYRDRAMPEREQPQGTPPQTLIPGHPTPSTATDFPVGYTNLAGMRRSAHFSEFFRPRSSGLGSTGELAVFGKWNQVSGLPEGSSAEEDGLLILGADTLPQNTLPLDVRIGMSSADSPPLSIVDSYEAIDDAEERLALFRPLSNIVTTRSDVFTAWFVVRGYSPADIEAIRTDLGSDEAAISRYFNGGGVDNRPPLRPAFEQRWLAVLDRSNVRSATDRPRVLLLVELPIDKPAAVAN